MNKVELALKIATSVHAGQVDKSGAPYILHCVQVMSFVAMQDGYTHDEELLCIALLHDVVEDSTMSRDVMLNFLRDHGFSDRVVDAVDCLSKRKVGQSYKQYQMCVCSNKDAIKVKLADLKHNSDLSRLSVVTQKDLDRNSKYEAFTKLLMVYNVVHEHNKSPETLQKALQKTDVERFATIVGG